MATVTRAQRDARIAQNLDIAREVATTFAKRMRLDPNDWISVAYEALIEFCSKEHAAKSFPTLLRTALRNKLLDELRLSAVKSGDTRRAPSIRRRYRVFMQEHPEASLIDVAIALEIEPDELQQIVESNPITDIRQPLAGVEEMLCDMQTPDTILETLERISVLRRAVSDLPQSERVALQVTLQLGGKGAAARLGVSRQAVNARYQRALARLRLHPGVQALRFRVPR